MRADLIREARKRAGLTQRELAERAATTQSSVARRESGSTATPGSSRPPATRVPQPWPEASPANLDRLAVALRARDARVRHLDTPQGQPFSYDATSLAAEISWDLTTPFGEIGIALTPAGATGYGSLVAGAAVIDSRATPVQLAGLADVVDSTANRPKDHRALPVLRELLAPQTRVRAGRPRP